MLHQDEFWKAIISGAFLVHAHVVFLLHSHNQWIMRSAEGQGMDW